MIRKTVEALVLLIIVLIALGAMFQMFVETVRPLMPYIIGAVLSLAVLAGLFLIGRAIYLRQSRW